MEVEEVDHLDAEALRRRRHATQARGTAVAARSRVIIDDAAALAPW